ncbi:MAG: CoA activase, partial [Bacteroidetes bacterium]|nr:CoA activase [Bacteroidota bacterium]
ILVGITGSAGMGIAERCGIPFIQEAVSCAGVVRTLYPEVRTLLDVGGEDTKLIFFDDRMRPDIRMNGNCAGGTGAFIDQMATLLNIDLAGLNALAARHQHCYPIASRCGVFAKTDVQNLISRQIPKEDIAATIFQAVAIQTRNTLARGASITPKILFCGGPLTFFSSLRKAFTEVLQVSPEEVILPVGSEFLPALGAAVNPERVGLRTTMQDLVARTTITSAVDASLTRTVTPLFANDDEFQTWSATRARASIERIDLSNLSGEECFLGVDSGSTTTKIVLIDSHGRLGFEIYTNNKGEPLHAVSAGLHELREKAADLRVDLRITGSGVTGYGEDLVRAAFGFDEGIVETLAHFRAARAFQPDVSFILDIGGQDMKAIFIENGDARNIEINEACSSGCGSFLETFAHSLGTGVAEFAECACHSASPCDLGSRCTVFMNSQVKQSLREGMSVADISAGLAYSVIKNCIQKVLRVHDTSVLGNAIVVQGGTFRNPAVHRALELIVGKPVICPDIPELMGAYGAALTALDSHTCAASAPGEQMEGVFARAEGLGRRGAEVDAHQMKGVAASLSELSSTPAYATKTSSCKGCENSCTITTFVFENGTRFFSGNKCEKIFTNRGKERKRGTNLVERQLSLIFDRRRSPEGESRLTIGIPRVLNMYENFPFWCTLFVESGIDVELSPVSTHALCDKGVGTIMSDNICFPAKLVHGHIQSLMDSAVDRIFYPMAFYEKDESGKSSSCWNCPIVAAYPDVIRSAMNPEKKSGIPFDTPTVAFHDVSLLKKASYAYLRDLGVPRSVFRRAFNLAIEEQSRVRRQLREEAQAVIEDAEATGKPLVVLAARPYHLDPLINHKVPEILADLGANVLTVDALPGTVQADGGDDILILSQWGYPNRLFEAARWVAAHPQAELVQLNSFGCGPDALTV